MANLFLPGDYVTKMHEKGQALAVFTGHFSELGNAKPFQTV